MLVNEHVLHDKVYLSSMFYTLVMVLSWALHQGISRIIEVLIRALSMASIGQSLCVYIYPILDSWNTQFKMVHSHKGLSALFSLRLLLSSFYTNNYFEPGDNLKTQKHQSKMLMGLISCCFRLCNSTSRIQTNNSTSLQIKNFHAQINCSNKSKANSSDALMHQAFGPQTQAQGFFT